RLTPILIPLLIVMATAKFALVALFFMHLRYDPRPLKLLFLGPLIIAVLLAIALASLTGAFLVFGRGFIPSRLRSLPASASAVWPSVGVRSCLWLADGRLCFSAVCWRSRARWTGRSVD